MKRQMVVVTAAIILVTGLSSWAGGACCAKSAKAAGPACEVKTMSEPSSAEAKTQTVCPVMGRAVNKSHYVDYKGKRVYFCCGACVSAFQQDPEKYLKKLADDGVQIEDAPVQ